ncbi:ABC transporter permease subunit [Streptomyces sp. NPDC012616]|uniref:amino acid ABC transporter permease n=1 Tax=Streptomyces sp. NPDC012616 TaxID=3364840 RepID=UPI0036EA6254
MSTDVSSGAETKAPPPLHLGEAPTVGLKHPSRWIAVLVVFVLAAMAAHSAITNPNFRWDLVGDYFWAAPIMDGLRVTLTLTVICMAIGLVLGTALALMRLSPNPVLRSAAFGYVWLLRGVPLLVQLIVWYNLSALYPRLSLGIPFGPEFVSFESNHVITAYTAAILGLGLNQAAYMAEIIRAGLQSVDEGQLEAASALGMGRLRTMMTVVLPQAMRVILPPTGNETITMLKQTSLVSVVAVADLLYSTQLIYAKNFQTIPLLIMACIWYLIIISLLSVGQYYLERHFKRGSSRQQHKSLWQHLRRTAALRRDTSALGTEGSTPR